MRLNEKQFEYAAQFIGKPEYRSTNPKIDIFVDGVYVGSTNFHKKVSTAIAHYHIKTKTQLNRISANKCKQSLLV